VGEVAADSLRYRYDGGPRDVEAMYVAPDGTIHLISKRPLAGAGGRLRPALVFALPPSAWAARDSLAVARLVDSLPIVPGMALGRTITDAALSRDARRLAVRTYTQVYVFVTDPATGRARAGVPPAVCNIAALEERGGEGIAWLGESTRLLLTAEGRRSPMLVVECPLPSEARPTGP
jgi:hypothetical protein